jgi:hypothetical protein
MIDLPSSDGTRSKCRIHYLAETMEAFEKDVTERLGKQEIGDEGEGTMQGLTAPTQMIRLSWRFFPEVPAAI